MENGTSQVPDESIQQLGQPLPEGYELKQFRVEPHHRPLGAALTSLSRCPERLRPLLASRRGDGNNGDDDDNKKKYAYFSRIVEGGVGQGLGLRRKDVLLSSSSSSCRRPPCVTSGVSDELTRQLRGDTPFTLYVLRPPSQKRKRHRVESRTTTAKRPRGEDTDAVVAASPTLEEDKASPTSRLRASHCFGENTVESDSTVPQRNLCQNPSAETDAACPSTAADDPPPVLVPAEPENRTIHHETCTQRDPPCTPPPKVPQWQQPTPELLLANDVLDERPEQDDTRGESSSTVVEAQPLEATDTATEESMKIVFATHGDDDTWDDLIEHPETPTAANALQTPVDVDEEDAVIAGKNTNSVELPAPENEANAQAVAGAGESNDSNLTCGPMAPVGSENESNGIVEQGTDSPKPTKRRIVDMIQCLVL